MEHLNKIEIRGLIGNVRINAVDDKKVANFSVGTNYVYKGKDGSPVIETTWFNVVVWTGKGVSDLSDIEKGRAIYVTGRIRMREYTGAEGTERQVTEVIAREYRLLEPAMSDQTE